MRFRYLLFLSFIPFLDVTISSAGEDGEPLIEPGVVVRELIINDTGLSLEVPEPFIISGAHSGEDMFPHLNLPVLEQIEETPPIAPISRSPLNIEIEDRSPSPTPIPFPKDSFSPVGQRLFSSHFSPSEKKIQTAFHAKRPLTPDERQEVHLIRELNAAGEWNGGTPTNAAELKSRFADRLLAARELGKQVRFSEEHPESLHDPNITAKISDLLKITGLHYATPEARRAMALLERADALVKHEFCRQHPTDPRCARQHEFA